MEIGVDQITGTEKQGLGYCLIADGLIWPAKINDPGTITFTRNKLDATHSKTTGFKQEKFEELAEPLTQEMSTFFDPTLDEAIEVMQTAGATKKREIYMMIPRTILDEGTPVNENGFIYLPQGLLAANSITMPLDGFMEQALEINGGTANPTISKEKPPASLPATSITFTPNPSPLVGPIEIGTEVGKLTTDVAPTVDVSLFYGLAGTDGSDFVLVGNRVVAAVQLTNTGGTGSGDYKIDVSTTNLIGFDDNIASLQFTDTDIAVDVT